jgi:DNA-directed RNA polymerase subunit L
MDAWLVSIEQQSKIFINNPLFLRVMKVKVLEQKKNKLHVEIEAEPTLCNLLKKELWNDKDTHVSGFYTEHIQVGTPRFIIETSEKDPMAVLRDAIKRIKKTNANFLDAFNDAK